MISGVSPWVSMWTNPRPTLRTIVNVNPKYGVFYLAWIYALQTYLFFASYWSFGLSFSFFTILGAGILLSPLIGWIWVYFTGWVLFFTGGWLGGEAPMSHLRAAAAWSKIPSVISLFMWLILMISGAESVFINGVSGPSSLFINFIAFILSIWAFILLIQSIREVQGFSILRAIVNLIFAWLISTLISFLLVFVFRFFYLSI